MPGSKTEVDEPPDKVQPTVFLLQRLSRRQENMASARRGQMRKTYDQYWVLSWTVNRIKHAKIAITERFILPTPATLSAHERFMLCQKNPHTTRPCFPKSVRLLCKLFGVGGSSPWVSQSLRIRLQPTDEKPIHFVDDKVM